MAHPQRIQSLDIWALARSGTVLDGEHPVADLARLQSACSGPATSPVRWQLQGLLKPGPDGRDQPWMVLQVEAELPLSCVRCLQTVNHVFRLEREFRFVADEATAMAEDEDSEEWEDDEGEEEDPDLAIAEALLSGREPMGVRTAVVDLEKNESLDS